MGIVSRSLSLLPAGLSSSTASSGDGRSIDAKLLDVVKFSGVLRWLNLVAGS
jgi:hypothetical protein